MSDGTPLTAAGGRAGGYDISSGEAAGGLRVRLSGRDAAVAEIDAAIAAARGGSSRVVAIAGDAGMGKTRLLDELRQRAHAAGMQVVHTRCLDVEWAPGLAPWKDLVGQSLPMQAPNGGNDDPSGWLATLLPLIPGGTRPPLDAHTPFTFNADEERYRIAEALVQLMADVAGRAPLALVIDDAHWADDESVHLLYQVAASLGHTPMLVAIGWRDDERPGEGPGMVAWNRLRRLPHFLQIDLAGLSRPATGELIESMTGTRADPAVVAQVQDATDGNPFYIGELARHLHHLGALVTEDRDRSAPPELSLPSSLRQVVTLRLRNLSAPTQRMLRLASVCADGFSYALLQGLTELSNAELLDAIDEATAAHVITELDGGGERYDFAHGLVRRTLYDGWSPSRRARLHRSLAEWLVQERAAYGGGLAGEIARHYHLSRSIPGADAGLAYALEAAADAQRQASLDEAAACLRMASALAGNRPPAEQAMIAADRALAEAGALDLVRAHASALDALRMFDRAGVEDGTRARIVALIVTALHDGGQEPVLWSPLLQQALAWVDDDDRETWARLTLLQERFEPFSVGPVRGARWLGTNPAAIEIASRSTSEELFARSLQPWDLWEWERTQQLADQVATWKDPAAIIRALTVLGADWLYHHGAFRRAQAHFEHLHAVAELHLSVPGMAEAEVRLGIIHTAMGDQAAARAAESRAIDLVRRLGEGHRLQASLWWMRTFCSDTFGAIDPAAAEFFTSYIDDPFVVYRTIAFDDAALASYILARTGQKARSRSLLKPLVELLEQVEPTLWLYGGAVSLAAAAVWTLRETSLAPVLLACAERAVEAGHGDFPCQSNRLTIARMAALAGDAEMAAGSFALARDELEVSGQRPLRAMVDWDEASWLIERRHGTGARARTLLAEAERAFSALGMTEWATAAERLRSQSTHSFRIPGNHYALTRRESDVANLIANGCSDRDIADALYVSTRTVNTHVHNVLEKTGFRSRLEISNWVRQQRLESDEPGT